MQVGTRFSFVCSANAPGHGQSAFRRADQNQPPACAGMTEAYQAAPMPLIKTI